MSVQHPACSCRCHSSKFQPCDVPTGCADLHPADYVDTCGVCGSPTADQSALCVTHSQRLKADLGGVPELLAELETTICRQNRGPRGDGGKSAETPLIFNVAASGVRLDLECTLSAWCLDVSRRGEDDRDPLRAVDPHDHPGTAAWLVRNLDRLRHHPEAGQAYDEITDAIAQGWRAVDLAADLVVLGECTATEDPEGNPLPEMCRAVVYGHANALTATCRGCRNTHTIAVRREWMLRTLPDMPATTGALSRMIGHLGQALGGSTIRSWAAQGKLTAVGEDDHHRPLYLVKDVLTLFLGPETPDQPDIPAGAA